MARFEKTRDTLREIAGLMPAALSASAVKPAGRSTAELAKEIEAIFRKEDNEAVTIALLIKILINKFSGRSV